jgi:hypothetical protein
VATIGRRQSHTQKTYTITHKTIPLIWSALLLNKPFFVIIFSKLARFLSSSHQISNTNTLPFVQSLTDQCSKNMYKNYINLENFNHKLVIIFLADDKMSSPMFPIPREWQDDTGHVVSSSWWQHFLWPHGLSKGSLKWNTKKSYMQHTGSK